MATRGGDDDATESTASLGAGESDGGTGGNGVSCIGTCDESYYMNQTQTQTQVQVNINKHHQQKRKNVRKSQTQYKHTLSIG